MTKTSSISQFNPSSFNSYAPKASEFNNVIDGTKIANGAGVLTSIAAQELWMLVAPAIGIKLITPTKTANPYSSSKINYISPERDAFEKGVLKYFDTIPATKAPKKHIAGLEKWLKTADYNTNSASVVESAKVYVKQAKAAQAQAGSVFKANGSNGSGKNIGASKNTVGQNNKKIKKPEPEDDPEYRRLVTLRKDRANYLELIKDNPAKHEADLSKLQAELNADPTNPNAHKLESKIRETSKYLKESPAYIEKIQGLLLETEIEIANFLSKFNLKNRVQAPILKPKPLALPRSQKSTEQAPKDFREQSMLDKISRFKEHYIDLNMSSRVGDVKKALNCMKDFDKMTPQQQLKALEEANNWLFFGR